MKRQSGSFFQPFSGKISLVHSDGLIGIVSAMEAPKKRNAMVQAMHNTSGIDSRNAPIKRTQPGIGVSATGEFL